MPGDGANLRAGATRVSGGVPIFARVFFPFGSGVYFHLFPAVHGSRQAGRQASKPENKQSRQASKQASP